MQEKRVSNRQHRYKYIFGFLTPVCMLLLIYALSDIMPFGNQSVMTGDCTIQYSAFLAYMRELLSGNVSAQYTFSKVLGGDMASFLSYYTLSPFNVILLLFPNAHIQEAVLALILLKTGAAGCTMLLYLDHKRDMGWKTLLFSTAYALMGYNLVYQHNIMWLDGLVFLPLIIWGVEKTLHERKVFGKQNLLYLLSLSMLLLTNYYIGYMLCIFAVLYGAYYVLGDEDAKTFSGKEKWKAAIAFAVNSVLAGGLAAISLLPTALSLHGGKAAFSLRELLDFTILYRPLEIWKELFAGNYAFKGGLNTLPNIYCGVFALILAAAYFTSKKILMREKIGSILLMAFLYLSFLLSAFDRIWHGTTVPAGAPHRYSFVFSFFLLLVAYKGFCRIGESESREKRSAVLVYAAFLVLYVIAHKKVDGYLLFNIGLSIIFVAGLFGNRVLGMNRQVVVWLFPLGILFELLISGYTVFHLTSYTDVTEFSSETTKSQKYIDFIKDRDQSWYRMEQSGTNVTMNDAMLFQYNGLWSYSSCEKENTKRLAGKFGLNDRTWWIIYHNEVPAAAESLLGLKYVITTQPLADGKDYEAVYQETETGVSIYENPYTLPAGMLVGKKTAETNMDTWDVLAMENDLWKRMTGRDEDIYLYAEREETRCEAHLIEYQLVVENELPIYTCFRNYGTIREMTVLVNGEQVRQVTPEMQTYCLGTYQKGDVLTIRIYNQESDEDMSWYDLYFYYERLEYLREYSALLQSQEMQMTEYTQGSLSGIVNNETETEQMLLLTIPADKGWTVLVDGAAQPIESIAGGFIGVTIPPGQHMVNCSFVTLGLWQGAAISLAAVCILLLGNQAVFPWHKDNAREVSS